jgi:hypothetical protein
MFTLVSMFVYMYMQGMGFIDTHVRICVQNDSAGALTHVKVTHCRRQALTVCLDVSACLCLVCMIL